MKIEAILWEDAQTCDGWDEESYKGTLAEVTSIGVVVHENKKSLTIAGTYCEGHHNNRITIPKDNILKRKVIDTLSW